MASTTRPEVLEALRTFVDLAPRAARLGAPVLAELEKVDPADLAEVIAIASDRENMALLRNLMGRGPDLIAVLDALPMQTSTLEFLKAVNNATAQAASSPPQSVGLMGLLGVLRDPGVQRTLGFGVSFSQHLASNLEARPAIEGK